MKRWNFKAFALCFLLLSSTTMARSSSGGGDWVVSGGFGLMFNSGTQIMIAPQLEYELRHHLYLGPLIQVGFGNPFTLATFSVSGRYVVGNHPRVKPSLEGDLGLTTGASTVGVHIAAGVGLDFQVTHAISVGTLVRANFGPPVKTFFVSWPILVGRLQL